MIEEAELSISELRRRRAGTGSANGRPSSPEPAATGIPAPSAAPIQRQVIEARPAAPIAAEPQLRMSEPAILSHPIAPPRPQPGPRSRRADSEFDTSRFASAARRRWYWLAAALMIGAAIGYGLAFERANYTLPVTFALRDLSSSFLPGADADSYQPPKISAASRVDFLSSPELLRHVGARMTPAVSARELRARLVVDAQKDSDAVTVTLAGKDPQALLAFANLYSTAAVEQSRLTQVENPNLTYARFVSRLSGTEKEEAGLNEKLARLRTNAGLVSPLIESAAYEKEWTGTQLSIDMKETELEQLSGRAALMKDEPLFKALQDAENRLIAVKAQGKLDHHPDVVRIRDEITDLQKQISGEKPRDSAYALEPGGIVARRKALEAEIAELKKRAEAQKDKIDELYENTGEYTQLKGQLELLHTFRDKVQRRMFEAQQYRENAEGYYRIAAVPSLEDTDNHSRQFAAARGGLAGSGLGLALAFLLVCGVERLDSRLKTAADIKRVTGLPVLASLGDLDRMDEAARKAWAFRTWTILSDSLVQSGNSGAVCGIISCAHGEGRTTWVELLVNAARQRGLGVTKLAFQCDEEAVFQDDSPVFEPEQNTAACTVVAASGTGKLGLAKSTPVVHVQLPSLVWDLERRIQFQQELEKWQKIPYAVVLVDLPPASLPEAILLAENLPQVLWLVDSGKSQARETRLHLETLRHARCRLIGAVLNHEPEPLIPL